LNLVLSYGDLARPGGYRTRVLGELEALDCQEGLDPFLLVFDRNPIEFEKSFYGDVPHRVFHRSAVLQFYPAVARIGRQKSIKLVHAHNLYSAALALSRRRHYGYKVVLDYHGRIPEEYVFLGKGGEASRRLLEALERWCVKKSDHVIAVSHQLAEYLVARYKVPPKNISVVPCCTDAKLFTWDPQRREAVRRSMNLSGKFVCTHLGSFFEWYDPEMVMSVFQQVRSHLDGHLLVITSDVEKAGEYLSARFPREAFTVRHAAHEEVPGLLNASDVGLLLLRHSPNIKTSSPAKFAEYLNGGLPVLVTAGVGDFSALVETGKIGAVIGDKAVVDAPLLNDIQLHRSEFAARCTAAGTSLTWQAAASVWKQVALQLNLLPSNQ
jgi:glycosyltransferase involved in cell wall biosynthesis